MRNILNVYILLGVVFLSFLSTKGQSININSDSLKAADELIETAKKVIYIDKKDVAIKSVFLSTSGSHYNKAISKTSNSNPLVNETRSWIKTVYSISYPSFVKITDNRDQEVASGTGGEINLKITIIANGNQVHFDTDALFNGQKLDLGKGAQAIGNIFDKNKIARVGNTNIPRSAVDDKLQSDLFPIFLYDPAGNPPIFHYVGKAKADGKTADVIEFIPHLNRSDDRKQTVRYFFDSETHLLLLITDGFISDQVKRNTTIYFSGYKKISGILVPSKIKKETKIVSTLKLNAFGYKITETEIHTITDLTVDEFEVNRKFSDEIFNISK